MAPTDRPDEVSHRRTLRTGLCRIDDGGDGLDEIPCVHYEMLMLGGTVRVAPYATFGSPELASSDGGTPTASSPTA